MGLHKPDCGIMAAVEARVVLYTLPGVLPV
jgi:hypothetical protein